METVIPDDEAIDDNDTEPDAMPDVTGGIEDTPEPADEEEPMEPIVGDEPEEPSDFAF